MELRLQDVFMTEIDYFILIFILIMPFYCLFMTIFFHKNFESGFKCSNPEETILYVNSLTAKKFLIVAKNSVKKLLRLKTV